MKTIVLKLEQRMDFSKLIAIVILLISLSAFAGPTLPVEDGFKKGGTVPVSVVTSKQAQDLFKKFKGNDDFVFQIPDGCFARALMMTRIAEEKEIEMGKVWLHGVLTPGSEYKNVPTKWGYHVAPILYVTEKNISEKPKLMVIDPSLFEKPVPVDEWKMKMLSKESYKTSKLYYSSRFQYENIDGYNKKKYSWDREDLDDAAEVLNTLARAAEGIEELPGMSSESLQGPFKKGIK